MSDDEQEEVEHVSPNKDGRSSINISFPPLFDYTRGKTFCWKFETFMFRQKEQWSDTDENAATSSISFDWSSVDGKDYYYYPKPTQCTMWV